MSRNGPLPDLFPTSFKKRPISRDMSAARISAFSDACLSFFTNKKQTPIHRLSVPSSSFMNNWIKIIVSAHIIIIIFYCQK